MAHKGSGPINPFPLDRTRRSGRAHAHHNPIEPFRNERSGLYRPRVPSRVTRGVPDEEFNEIFAKLPSHRDRALVAFYVSTGARASELLSVTLAGVAGLHGRVRLVAALPDGDGRANPRGTATATVVDAAPPSTAVDLSPAAHRMFERAGEAAGSTATLPLRAIGRKRWTSCSGPDVVTEVVTFPGIASRPSKAQRESARTRFPPRPMVTDWPGCWTGWLTSRARPGSASSPVVRGRPAPDNHGGSSRNAPRWAPIGPVDGAGVGVFASARSGRPRDDPSYGPPAMDGPASSAVRCLCMCCAPAVAATSR